MIINEVPPYAPVLMESTRAIGYSLEAAVADIVDNSISANATEVDIYFSPYKAIPYVAILDNGDSMSDQEMDDAMRYGSQSSLENRNSNDLGRFGLGMKTASLSQCRCLTVICKQKNFVFGRRWDLDEVIRQNSWALLEFEVDDFELLPHMDDLKTLETGTLVIWENLDRMLQGVPSAEQSMGIQMDSVRDHLSLVFHRYLAGEKGINKVLLKLNKLSIEPRDPFLIGKSTQNQADENFVIEGSTVSISCYVLPHISKMTKEDLAQVGGEDGLVKNQGFYVYRNKRLLVWGTWFRLHRKDALSKLARVRVDITNDLDHLWSLDVKKSTATPPEIIRDNLKRVVSRITTGSKRTWTYRGKKEVSRRYAPLWGKVQTRQGVQYSLNRKHPNLEVFKKGLTQSQNSLLESYLELIEQYLPLNEIYVDFNKDEQINVIDEDKSEKILLNHLQIFINNLDEGDRVSILENLKKAYPFSENTIAMELIDKEIERGN